MANTILYDNLSQPIGDKSDTLTNGRTDGFDFLKGSVGGTLSDLKLTLVDSTPKDGGSVVVRLFFEKDLSIGAGFTPIQQPDQQLAVLGAVDDATELDAHDIVLAEGLPAESYLEMDNRAFFAEANVVALTALPDAPSRTHADFCRPYHASDLIVDAVRARLDDRAETLRRETATGRLRRAG